MQHKKTIIIGICAVIGLALLYQFVISPYVARHFVPSKVDEVVMREDLGFLFKYPGGEEGYSFVQPPLTDEMKGTGLLAAFIMMDAAEYEAYQGKETAGEAPRSMSVFVLADAKNEGEGATGTPEVDRLTKIKTWAEAHPTFTSYNVKQGEPESVSLDSATAIRYKADGLYPQEVYVAFYKKKYYIFVGQYDGDSDPMKKDFESLVQSVLFQ